MDQTSIADDLLLLLLDDESGKMATTTFLDIGIGGALLVELSLLGAVEVTEKERFRQQKVVPTGGAPALGPVLADALAVVAEKERPTASLVPMLGKKRKDVLLARLQERGILRAEHDKILGLFPRTRWPAADSTHENGLRRRIDQALIARHTDDSRIVALISLLSALDVTSRIVETDGLSKREIKQRAKAISDGDWAGKAVRDAVLTIRAALIAVAAASAAASS